MSRIVLRHDCNRNVNFIHVINLLVDYKIMTLEEAHSLYVRFKLGEDVVFDVRDDMVPKFRDALDSLNCSHE